MDSKTGVPLQRKTASKSLFSSPFALLSSTRQPNREQNQAYHTQNSPTAAQLIDHDQTESQSGQQHESSWEEASASASKPGDETSVTNSLVTRFTVVKVCIQSTCVVQKFLLPVWSIP